MNTARSGGSVENGIANFAPLAATVFLALVMLLPVGTGVANVMMPHFVLIATFYWLLRRPALMPYGACAAIGFLLDLWLAVPLGLNMLMLLSIRLFILSQIKYLRGQTRLVQWLVFALFTLILYTLSWFAVALAKRDWLPVEPLFTQWLVTTLSYAPVALVIGRLRRVMV